MSYRIHLVLVAVVLVLLMGHSRAAVITVDNFNSYTNASYIQVQNTKWSRFGNATTDGIYSIAGGVGGTRGASYSATWTATNNTGAVMYTYDTVQDFSSLTSVSLDLDVSTLVTGTTVSLQLRSGGTTYQSTTPVALTNLTYNTFTFDTGIASLTKVAGGGTYAATLSAVDAIAFIFNNAGGTGSQNMLFDNFNLNLTAVPEPSTVALLGLTAVGLCLVRRRKA